VLQVATVDECELLLAALMPHGFDRSLFEPMAQSMMAGELSRWGALWGRSPARTQSSLMWAAGPLPAHAGLPRQTLSARVLLHALEIGTLPLHAARMCCHSTLDLQTQRRFHSLFTASNAWRA
jgi:hypothetical protein